MSRSEREKLPREWLGGAQKGTRSMGVLREVVFLGGMTSGK